MSDILSQEEVDALLSAVSVENETEAVSTAEASAPVFGGFSSGESEKSLSLYDFRRPDRVSKDQMRTLQNLHEGFARQFSTTHQFPAHLRGN